MLLRETSAVLFSRLLVVAVLLGVASTPAGAQTTLYDDFNAPQVNPDKWLGVQAQFGGQGGLELVRDIDFDPTSLQGSLPMSHRVAGGTSTNTGQRDSRNRLLFLSPAAITAVKFDVAVTEFSLLDRGTPRSVLKRVAPQLLGFLFNGPRLGIFAVDRVCADFILAHVTAKVRPVNGSDRGRGRWCHSYRSAPESPF